MAVPFRSAAVKLPPRTIPTVKPIRKIGLVGSHSASLSACPWGDPSWELWGHAASRPWCRRELDRYFELHRKECWTKNGKEHSRYVEWLKTNLVPVYMHRVYPEVPASKAYPKERILMEYGGIRRYFKNQAAWMIALAFSEGVTHLGLFGINYSHDTEYQTQRGSAEYWLGRAEERGVHVILPEESSLLSEPVGLYGFESHDKNGKRLPQWAKREPKVTDTIQPLVPGQERKPAEPPAWLLSEIQAEEAQRPDWAKCGDQPEWLERTDGGAQKG